MEKQLYERIRQLGYWDRPSHANDSRNQGSSMAWSNPNTSSDPETMFKLLWLLGSSRRLQRLCSVDARIIEQTAADLAANVRLPSATKSYVKYLWEQVRVQESPHLVG